MPRSSLAIALSILLSLASVHLLFGQDDTHGLWAAYYNNRDFSGPAVTRIDPQINFDWGYDSPDPAIGADNFSVRWVGQIEALYTETYTFTTNADNGIRLWIDRQLIVDDWSDHPLREASGRINLNAGQRYVIQVEYYEADGGAIAEIYWSSASQAKEIIPGEQLYLGDLTEDDVLAPLPTATPVSYSIAATNRVNARSCPQLDCEVQAVIAPNTQISVFDVVEGDTVSDNDQWLRVIYNGELVYVHSSLAEQIAAPTATTTIDANNPVIYTVQNEQQVNMRACAAMRCEVVAVVSPGDSLAVVDIRGDWLAVLLPDGQIGYIVAALARPEATATPAA